MGAWRRFWWTQKSLKCVCEIVLVLLEGFLSVLTKNLEVLKKDLRWFQKRSWRFLGVLEGDFVVLELFLCQCYKTLRRFLEVLRRL